jgi:hypothetical protein
MWGRAMWGPTSSPHFLPHFLMKSPDSVGYVGLPDSHDGVVLRASLEGKTAEVVVAGYSGREHVVLFEGVQAVEMNQPEDMLPYSLSGMRALPPLRKFVFANNEEDHSGYWSILATDFCVVRLIMRRRSVGDSWARPHNYCLGSFSFAEGSTSFLTSSTRAAIAR